MRLLFIALTLALLLAGIGWWLFGDSGDVLKLNRPQAGATTELTDPGGLAVSPSERREVETEVVASAVVNETEEAVTAEPEAVIAVHLLVLDAESRARSTSTNRRGRRTHRWSSR